MPTPDFLVIGAMKAGTTALHSHLRLHPQLWMPESKELDFFCEQGTWARGPAWYASQFDAAPSGAVLGEASPNYTKAPLVGGVPKRIARMLPDVRLVYVLRHPIRRMQSHWAHQVADGRMRLTVDEALTTMDDHLVCSSYAMQLEAYLEHFDRDRILLLRSEDLRGDPPGTLLRLCRFLGVEDPPPAVTAPLDAHVSADKRVPRRGWGPVRAVARAPGVPQRLAGAAARAASRPAGADQSALAPEVHQRLVERLRPDLERLVEIAGPDFEPWGLLDARRPGVAA